MNFKDYKIKSQKKFRVNILLVIIALIVISTSVFQKNSFLFTQEANSFLNGSLLGLVIVAVSQTVKLGLALKDDNKLKVFYNEENDERKQLIKMKAGLPLLAYLSYGMIIIGLLFSTINITITNTLLLVGIIQIIIAVCLKVYYLKTI